MLYQPFYDPEKTYLENFERGPFGAFSDGAVFEKKEDVGGGEFLGEKVNSFFGIPSGPLLNSCFVKAAFDKGFDLCVYKTIRTRKYPCYEWPNVLSVKIKGDLDEKKAARSLVADRSYQEPLSITNSFGAPSFDPDFWQEDISRAIASAREGQLLIGSFQGTKSNNGSPEEYYKDFALAARLLREAGVKVLEVNFSCPNEGTNDLLCFNVRAARKAVEAVKNEIGNTPLIVKIAYFKDNYLLRSFVSEVGGLVEGISAINTIPAQVVDGAGEQALPGKGRLVSGVCGKAIRWAGLEMTERLKNIREEQGFSYSLVGIGGVFSREDYLAYRQKGAEAVMSATGAMWNPYLAKEIKEKEEQINFPSREEAKRRGFVLISEDDNPMNDLSKQIAKILLEIKAVGFSFDELITFVSGIKSPVYVDNRKLPYYPEHWQKVIEGFVKVIEENNLQFDVIAGIESGGIPHSASLGYLLKKPSVFVRKKPKDHGLSKRIAGGDVKDKRVLLVEDLVTTGGSALAGVKALREEGAKVSSCLAIFSYGFEQSKKAFYEAGINFYSLTDFSSVLTEALSRGIIDVQEEAAVKRFIVDPFSWHQSIIDKYNQRADKVNSLLCVGLDSDIDKLPESFRTADFPQFEFNKQIIDQTHSYVAAYKFNIAFYEERGSQGLIELKKSVDYLKENYPDIFRICDAKRGDIGNTNKGYIGSILDWLDFDAITVHPYLGREAMEPFLNRSDKGIIVLCRTSNPGAGELQDLISGGEPIWQIVAKKVRDEWNKNNNCLLVVGATYPVEMADIRKIVDEMTFLVPGIGIQGGNIEAVVKAGLNAKGKGLIVNSSRGVIFSASPKEEATKLRDEINCKNSSRC